MKRMSPLDAAWLYVDTPDTPMHVANLVIFSLPDDASSDYLRDVVASLRAQTNCVPPFNLRLRSTRFKGLMPVWDEADDIDLDYHLRHSALPQPGGERELGVLVSRLHSHPMDFHRPLWEMHVIEGLENNRFALYMKIHHSLVDGVGGMRMLQRMLSFDPSERQQPPPWAIGYGRSERPSAARPPRTSWQRLKDAVGEQVATLPGVSRALGEVVREAASERHDASWALPFEAPKSVLNGQISGQRRFATQHYDLVRIRGVAKAAGVTVNDVFLGLCSSTLRRYLRELNVLPETSLTAGVPVSVRPADDNDSANAISFIITHLGTQIADPIERLHAIHESAQVAKVQLQKLSKADITNYTALYMAPFILQLASGLGGRTRPMFNITISNVPGPDRPLYFNGARLEQMYPLSLLPHGQALNITVVSYAGQFNVGFTGCRDTLPSMQRLAVYMGEALEEYEALLAPAMPKNRKTSANAKAGKAATRKRA